MSRPHASPRPSTAWSRVLLSDACCGASLLSSTRSRRSCDSDRPYVGSAGSASGRGLVTAADDSLLRSLLNLIVGACNCVRVRACTSSALVECMRSLLGGFGDGNGLAGPGGLGGTLRVHRSGHWQVMSESRLLLVPESRTMRAARRAASPPPLTRRQLNLNGRAFCRKNERRPKSELLRNAPGPCGLRPGGPLLLVTIS